MVNQVVAYKLGGIDIVKKDIKRLNLDENAFILSLNSVIGKEYKDLDDIPSDLIPDLITVTRSMVLHIIGLNTIIEKLGIEKITPDFEFSIKNSSEFVRRLASDGNISSGTLKMYIMNKRQYIENLLIHVEEEKINK